MLRNIALKSLRDIQRGFLWWSVGLAGFVALIVSVWPTVHSNPGLNKLAQDYPKALQAFLAFGGAVDYSSPAGYLGIELFSLMVPLLLLVAAIGTGAGSIAGEEERGTLELLLANPVSRTKVVLEKTVALLCELTGLGVVLWLALWIGALLANMDISGGSPRGGHAERGPARARLRSDRRSARRGHREADGCDRSHRGGSRCCVPRERPGATRPRARGAAEALALLPLCGRRSAPQRHLVLAHGGAGRDRGRRHRARALVLLAP